MDIKLDRVADAVYVSVNSGFVSRTLEMDDNINVDMDANGHIVGIEILNASSQTQLVEGLQRNVKGGVPVEIISGTPLVA